MKEWDIFQKIRLQKNKFNLKTRLTLLVGAVIVASALISIGIALLVSLLFPNMTEIPMLIQIIVLILIVAMCATRLLSKLFFDPVKKLCEGMRKVADGDFSTRLDTDSSSVEINEMMAGFNMMVHELQSTEILQTDFVSNVSHEFKTPINAIEGYATLLQNTESMDENENEYVDKILFNTKRLSSLVSNILLLSKIENQTISVQHKERFRLDEQVREVIVSLESAWEAKDIDFDVELAEIHCMGNENMLYHVWMNLISNAIKFSPKEGNIKIRLFQENGEIRFTVEDDGPGLSEEAKKHIFDKFYQQDTSHKEEGNGLGLALVKRILSVANGTVTAENVPGHGCRFTVVLTNET